MGEIYKNNFKNVKKISHTHTYTYKYWNIIWIFKKRKF